MSCCELITASCRAIVSWHWADHCLALGNDLFARGECCRLICDHRLQSRKLARLSRGEGGQKLVTAAFEPFVKYREAITVLLKHLQSIAARAEDWWSGLLVTGYMTGWRIGQLLSLKWSDIDLDAGTAIGQADVTRNKGKREEKIPLHPVVIEHLKKLAGSFDTHVFPWKRNRRELWPTFQTIQEAATLGDNKPMPKAGKTADGTGSTI